MSTPQPGKSGIDVRLDEQGRIVVLSPELAQFAPSDGNIPIDPPTHGGWVTNNCPNLVKGCGSPLAV
ncbi:hypothetical protein ACGF12_14810 [Kitasatospora sp. NPDC048296]|uniref:hypothetical protein n=1 Tax=Kitasatospora sp. NPDC048296 TaxID=3364048 RepID=UPI00371FA87A